MPWDYVFIYSNAPTPRMLDRVRTAIALGRNVVLVYFKRPGELVRPEAIPCDTLVRPVRYRTAGLRRVLAAVPHVLWLRSNVFNRTAANADVYVDALDGLAVAMAAGRARGFRFRYENRDLHPLQLGRGVFPALVQAMERRLLKRIHTLVLTSEAFHRAYYHRIYDRDPVVVENWPDPRPWNAFARGPGDEFCVGWIGVVRYERCIWPMLEAVATLRAEGLRVRVKIAGGAADAAAVQRIRGYSFVELRGPFVYDRDCHDIFRDVDLIYAVYDTADANVRVALPNKLYESLLGRIPIMVAAGTFLEQRVEDLGIGCAVTCDDASEIRARLREAIERRGWYEHALHALERVDVGSLRTGHEKSLYAAVLG